MPTNPPTDDPESVRRDFARAWGSIGAAWGVTPSTAAVQGYLLLHGGPLTEANLREALGLSHRAALVAIRDCEAWGLVVEAEPQRAGQRGPAAKAWKPVGDHWEWFRRVAAARKVRETDPVLPLLEDCDRRAALLQDPELSQRIGGLLEFVHQFDGGIDAVVRTDAHAIARLFAVLDRLSPEHQDRLLRLIVAIPEDELVRAAQTLSGMSPGMVRGFVALASAPGLGRLVSRGG
jgi:DNA-binding transcriptional regulator GbsR (MarR family)